MDSNKKKIARNFDRAAQNYDLHAALQRDVCNDLFDIARKYISDNSFILDIGCGTGYFHELLRKNKIKARLLQMDISFNMCKVAKEYSSPEPFGLNHTVCGDFDYIALRDEVVTNVFSSLVYQWSFDLERSFAGVINVLKEGGYFAFALVGEGSLESLRDGFSVLGRAGSVNEFVDRDFVASCLERQKLQSFSVTTKKITKEFKGVRQLLANIKGVGGNTAFAKERSYAGGDFFSKLTNVYDDICPVSGKVRADWNIIFVEGQK